MSKIKNDGLDQYGAEDFEQQQFGTAGIEGVNFCAMVFSDQHTWCIVFQDLGYTVFSTVCAFYLPCVVMMVIYGKVFQEARARIHKKRFRSQPQQHRHQQQQQQKQQPCRHQTKLKRHLRRRQEQLQCHQQQQQQQQSDMDASLDVGQLVSSASDGVVHPETPDDGGVDSIVSQSPSPRHVLGTNVTLTVFSCDDDDDDDIDRTTPASVDDGGPLQPVARPTRLALREPDRNGILSPSESLETPSRSAQFLATPHKSSPSPSLRGSWLDLTKQFIMDRKRCLSPESKVGDCERYWR